MYQNGLTAFCPLLRSLSFAAADASCDVMGAKLVIGVLALAASAAPARAMAPLYDPVVLNIGINCQWQQHCERRQHKAMNDARKFIAAKNPPLWRIHLCNRNARRSASRIDWAGFNACIRNPNLSPPPVRRRRRR